MKTEIKIDILNYLKALTLNERYKIMELTKKITFDDESFSNWRERKNILHPQTFDKMLELMNYNKNIFSHSVNPTALMDVDLEHLHNFLNNQTWYTVLQDSLHLLSEDNSEYNNSKGFTFILRPFILYVEKEITSQFEKYNSIFNKEVIKDILDAFIFNSIQIAMKTILLELNVSRLRGELSGDSPEDRFHSFNNLFAEKDRLIDFYSEYILLARLLSTKAHFTVKNTIEFLENITINKKTIYEEFNLDEDDLIESISPGLGDSHNEGNTVISLTMSSGKKYLYKPRDSQIAIAYHDLINWLNSKESILKMGTYKIINFGTFSVEEFVPHMECNSEEEVKEYYTRFGQIIALMYILNGRDMHMENIIAKGNTPVIVDTETLLHSYVPVAAMENANFKANMEKMDFVSSTLLLPGEINFDTLQNKGVDLSALNGQERALPYEVPGVINNNTDTMMYGMIETKLPGSNNLPMYASQIVSYHDYIDEIIKGFRTTCSVIMAYKSELLDADGVIKQFEEINVRIIAKGTSQYASLLSYIYHPDFLRDAIERDKVFENIWVYPYQYKEVIRSEYRDMLNDDIPIFFNNVNSKDLIDSKGNILKDIFKETAFNRLVTRVSKLDENEINRQISVIKVHTGKVDYENEVAPISIKDYANSRADKGSKVDHDDTFIQEAIKIEKELRNLAIYSDDEETVTWLDIFQANEDSLNINALSSDLYNGLGGIFIFYHNLYKVTKNKEYREIANKILTAAEHSINHKENYSALTGRLSLLYPYSILVLEEKDTEAEKKLDKLLELISENMNSIEHFDWIDGTTGIASIVLNLLEKTGNIDYLTISIMLGNKLVQQLNDLEKELIGGFAHGASSVALVLMRLGSLTNVKSFTDKGLEILNHDRSFYSIEHNGWLNKAEYDSSIVRYDWCHGSVGIGLSRLLMRKYYSDDLLDTEIIRALESTEESNCRNSDGICHGNFGVTEILLAAYQHLQHEEYIIRARKLSLKLIDDAKTRGYYLTGGLDQFPKIGMFTGLAGIGNQLLRVSSPDTINSVLVLE
ncbi:type 2 lanthipeptide synthetase LanM family protein [Cytobacillus gottheilii]|uniref:type 2 lanthipeptide synthetase LanM family protein n=1 Tax=Cytobacillus gottheilii TaxID=859144 RepID=UPI0015940D82|nr:type 2 lanthipeptide synthetase LanM family protein [Cytobacillus gottheilii]